MAANPIYLAQEMTSITCGHDDCGITFALPARFVEELRRSHATFYCPRGHARAYLGQSEEEKLRAALEQKDWQLRNANGRIQRESEERRQAQCKVRGLRERIKRGRCPASRRCKARFENLHEHLKQHHPRHPWRTK